MPTHILAVCLGNICRSPTAEAAIAEAAEHAGVDVVVDSAGTGAWHVGDPPDPRMRAAAADVGLHLDGRARQLTSDDFDRFDLIVTMDHSNYERVIAQAPSAEAASRVRMFLDFDPAAITDEVPDPYYGGPEGFTDVVGMVRSAARALIASLPR